jgi:hypothetical protein
MVKPRVVETNEGIQGEYSVQLFDAMANAAMLWSMFWLFNVRWRVRYR